jgi:hypothetical protein
MEKLNTNRAQWMCILNSGVSELDVILIVVWCSGCAPLEVHEHPVCLGWGCSGGNFPTHNCVG